MNIDFNPDTEVEAIANGWKTAKEIYTDAGVKKLTWDNFKKSLSMIDHTQSFNRSNRNGGPLFSPEIEKQFQMWLMRNQVNQGRTSQTVKQATMDNLAIGVSLQVIIDSGNEEAFDEYMGMARDSLLSKRNLKLEQAKTHQLQLENKQLVEENDYLKKANDFTTAQLGYYKRKYHSYYDDYENY